MFNAEQLPEIWETEEDKKLEIKQLKGKYTKYAHRLFINETPLIIFNQNTQWKIEVTTRVIREWWRKSRTRPRIIAIQLLDIMVETAILIKTGEDTKHTPGIESVSEFENWCMIEGNMYKIRIVVKKQPARYFVYYFGAVRQDDK
ncbi:MAG: hypothetical protein LBQ94_00430 [Treponema sp.]|nr:hypothetical protein [Treponema sp.]